MKYIQPFFFVLLALFAACTQTATVPGDNPLKTYFTQTEPGIQTGGTKIVTLKTDKGDFKIWTKRIGNNPKI